MGYYSHYRKWHDHSDPAYVRYMVKKFTNIFRGHLPRDKNAAILEIGCANGMALLSLKEMGYSNVVGIEIDEELSAIARHHGLEVLNTDAVQFIKETNKKYDFIYLFDVLEHFEIEHIPDFLISISKSLTDDGSLMLIIPNAVSPAGAYFRYIDWTHRTSFTPTSISYLLEEAGLNNIIIMDQSLIEEPKREDYQNDEDFAFDNQQWERARFFESFARGEMISMFGMDQYSLIVTPNMKIMASKGNLDKSKIEIRTQNNFYDLYKASKQMDTITSELSELKGKITTFQEEYLRDLHEVRAEVARSLQGDIVNRINDLYNKGRQSSEAVTNLRAEQENAVETYKRSLELLELEYALLRKNVEKTTIISEEITRRLEELEVLYNHSDKNYECNESFWSKLKKRFNMKRK